MAKVDYANWKKALWEAWRSFIPAFLGVIAIQLSAGVDLSTWKDWLPSLLIAGILAGVRAVGKWLRERYGEGNYDKPLYKLPL